jgi:uncharacterized protein with HEPN domain
MLAAIDEMNSYLGGRSHDEFLKNSLLQAAVMLRLMTIGEAAAHLSTDLRNRYPNVDWRRIIAFRNIVVHEYFAVDLDIVWTAATKNAEVLAHLITAILEAEYPDSI